MVFCVCFIVVVVLCLFHHSWWVAPKVGFLVASDLTDKAGKSCDTQTTHRSKFRLPIDRVSKEIKFTLCTLCKDFS